MNILFFRIIAKLFFEIIAKNVARGYCIVNMLEGPASMKKTISKSIMQTSNGMILHFVLVLIVAIALSACSSSSRKKSDIRTKTKFSQKEYGVTASPRMIKTKHAKIKRGGGRYQVGKAYKVRGRWYKPAKQPNYNKVGMASWYGPNFHGRLTANGEVYDMHTLSAAHTTLPLPSYARVTNLENNKSVVVRVNDRGPFAHKRVIDLSSRAADLLDVKKKGLAKVRVQYVGKARLDGKDVPWLEASYHNGRGKRPSISPGTSYPGTMLALAAPMPSTASTNIMKNYGPPETPQERPLYTIGTPVEILPTTFGFETPDMAPTGSIGKEKRRTNIFSVLFGKSTRTSSSSPQLTKTSFYRDSYSPNSRVNRAHAAISALTQ